MGDDYIPGNKCGLSTAGMKMLSGVAVAYGLENVSGSASPLNNVFTCASVCTFTQSICVCVCRHVLQCPLVCVWQGLFGSDQSHQYILKYIKEQH